MLICILPKVTMVCLRVCGSRTGWRGILVILSQNKKQGERARMGRKVGRRRWESPPLLVYKTQTALQASSWKDGAAE